MTTTPTKSNALDASKQKALDRYKDKLNDQRDMIAKIASKYVTPEAMLNAFHESVLANPRILDCEPWSILSAVVSSGRLGLKLDKQLRQADLIPRKVRSSDPAPICNLEIRAIGWVQLIKRAVPGCVLSYKVVREKDDFDWEEGTNAFLRHKLPRGMNSAERGLFEYTWAMITYPGGQSQFVVVDEEKMAELSSKAQTDKFWSKFPTEMRCAKAIKQLAKAMEIATETPEAAALSRAVGIADLADAGEQPHRELEAAPMDDDEMAEKMLGDQMERQESSVTGSIPEHLLPTELRQQIDEAAHAAGKGSGFMRDLLDDLHVTLSGQHEALEESFYKKYCENAVGVVIKMIQEDTLASKPSAASAQKRPPNDQEPWMDELGPDGDSLGVSDKDVPPPYGDGDVPF